MNTTFTREYKNVHAAQADIKQQAKRGYEVVSMTEIAQSAGIMRWLTLGFAALVFKPKPHVLVAYRLSPMAQQMQAQLAAAQPADLGQMSTAENLALMKTNLMKFGALFKREG